MSSSKTALIMGVANHRSLAWACVDALAATAGSSYQHIVCTYRDERFRHGVEKLVEEKQKQLQQHFPESSCTHSTMPSVQLHALPCDVATDVPLFFQQRLPELLYEKNGQREQSLDAVVHSIAYAPNLKDDGRWLLHTTREDYRQAHEISAYSFLEVARESLLLLRRNSHDGDDGNCIHRSPSLTALSYLGATRAVPNYSVMGPAKASLEAIVRGLALELGSVMQDVNLKDDDIASSSTHAPIRVNCVSAGPLSTLAARGIQGFSDIRHDMQQRAMLRRNVTAREVANTVAFLASDQASAVTGQTYHVDGGYSNVAGPTM